MFVLVACCHDKKDEVLTHFRSQGALLKRHALALHIFLFIFEVHDPRMLFSCPSGCAFTDWPNAWF